MADYETLRRAHGLRMMELAPDLVEALTWPPERLRAERETALRTLVSHAKAHSPWHRRRLADVDPTRLRVDDLRHLPVMTKDDLMTHFDQIVTDPRLTLDVVEAHLRELVTDAYLLDTYHVCASGGSSGRRGVFVFDIDGWVTAFVSYLRFSLRMIEQTLGAGPAPSVMATVAADKASHMTAAMGQTFAPPGGGATRFPATLPLDRIVDGLNGLQPDHLMGYSSMIHQLTQEATAGRLRIAPRIVSATSEPLLPETRAAVATVWGVPMFNGFGSTEGLMGGSCSAGRGIHLSNDLCIVEPVDVRGDPVPPGERAHKFYLTNLFNRTQPLVRYELTDEITVLDGPCPCGSTLLRIDEIQGRTDDVFSYPGGPVVHPFTFRSVLGRERNVVEYQVRQTVRGADVRVRCQGDVDTRRVAQTIADALVALGLTDAEVSVTPVGVLDRQETGKLRRFVPLSPNTR